MIVGIDIGGSSTKAMAYHKGIRGMTSVITTDPYAAAAGALGKLFNGLQADLEDIRCIALTGGVSQQMDSHLLGIPVSKVEEMEAIGLGGIELTGKNQALVVSMGTGTAVLSVRDQGRKIQHIGGTGVGGGTLLGLSRCMLNKYEIGSLWKLARDGDLGEVDLTIKDIRGGSVGFLPETATASNFGKMSDNASEADLALAIINMVGQVIGTIASFAAKLCNLESNVVLVGKVAANPEITQIIRDVGKLYNVEMTVPRNPDYCTALGAAMTVKSINSN